MKNSIFLRSLIGLVLLIILFHFLVILKVVPYTIVWAGTIEKDEEMYLFEVFSILMNLFFLLVLLMKANIIKSFFTKKAIDSILWFFILLFVLNSLGNLFAEHILEKCLTILTALLAFLTWKVLTENKKIVK